MQHQMAKPQEIPVLRPKWANSSPSQGPSALGNDSKKQDLRPEGLNIPLVFRLIERNDRPFRPQEDFRGMNSRAEGLWLGELLAPLAANHG